MTTTRMKPLSLDTSGMSIQEMENWGRDLIDLHKSLNWWIGDLARAARANKQLGEDNYSQVFPADTSPGLIQRCEAVARAYREKDRNPLATWSIHRDHTNDPDRIERVQAHVDAGRNSDEAREANKQERAADKPKSKRRLLAVDVNYEVARRFDTMGLEAAGEAAAWIERRVERLKADKNFTDVVCCFDSPNSFRKELTADWPEGDRYKERAKKDPELTRQLQVCEELLKGKGFCCVKIDGFEADDIMASYAKQFDGQVTLATPDKDMRQCLSASCNMLPRIEWSEDPASSEFLPDYPWITAKGHFEDGLTYSGYEVKGVSASEWTEFQTLAGDGTDNVSGAVGIGPKHTIDLLREFGTIEAAIAAAKEGSPSITPAKRKSLIEFAPKLDVTRQLVTLRTDLQLPTNTRI